MQGVETLKGNRQEKILELISQQVILTQEDLQNALQAAGFQVTQSTVSRDIKELRLIKGHDSQGNYRYLSAETRVISDHSEQHYRLLLSQSTKSIDYALNNVVVKCFPGMASGAAVALDALFSDRMLGCLAGDDTILIVVHNESQAAELVTDLRAGKK